MSLVLMPYGIFGSSASEIFSCKLMKDSISSNCVGERVGKSPVAELPEDVIGAHTLRHLWKLHLRKIENSFELVIQFTALFIFIVLSNSKICKKNINQYSFN
jgi:hypothetical protein